MYSAEFQDSGCGNDCLICSLDFRSCLLAGPGHGLDGQGGVRPCATKYCDSCAQDYRNCTSCNNPDVQLPGVGLNESGQCSPCQKPMCSLCSLDYATCEYMVDCDFGMGMDLDSGTCKPCKDPGCTQCYAQYDRCDICTSPLFPSSEGRCVNITIDATNCQYVSPDASRCLNCTMGLGPNAEGVCTACNSTSCLQCSGDYRVCEMCSQQTGLALPSNTCEPCDAFCDSDTCSSPGTCPPGYCQPGYGTVPGNGTCAPCLSQGCSSCFMDYRVCQADAPVCEWMTVTSDFNGLGGINRMGIPTESGIAGDVWTEPECAPNDAWAQPTTLLPNGTLRGVCYTGLPLPIAPVYYNLSQAILEELLDLVAELEYLDPTANSSSTLVLGNTTAELCPGGTLVDAVFAAPIAWCGGGFYKGGDTYFEVRFNASAVCEGSGGAPQWQVALPLQGLVSLWTAAHRSLESTLTVDALRVLGRDIELIRREPYEEV